MNLEYSLPSIASLIKEINDSKLQLKLCFFNNISIWLYCFSVKINTGFLLGISFLSLLNIK